MEGSTPAAFQDALNHAKRFVQQEPEGNQLVIINAWNEWTEGSYLLPDTENGSAHLEAIRRVVHGG